MEMFGEGKTCKGKTVAGSLYISKGLAGGNVSECSVWLQGKIWNSETTGRRQQLHIATGPIELLEYLGLPPNKTYSLSFSSWKYEV